MPLSGHVYAVDGWGEGVLWVDGTRVLAHDLPVPVPRGRSRAQHERGGALTAAPNGGVTPPLGTVDPPPSREGDGFVADLCRRFARHLAGERTSYDDVAVDDGWCTPFQAALLVALRAVPFGEVVTYGELAALAGRPGAARAAGSFCAGNRFSLLVPCHRVVAATTIGGYGDTGIETKRRLLALEGVAL